MQRNHVKEADLVDLVAGARAGDRECWDSIVSRFEVLVWAVVRSFGLGRADSFDAAQMVWLRLVERLDTIREPDRLGAWLVTTARREAMKLSEGGQRVAVADPLEAFRHLADPRDPFERVVDRAELVQVLDAFDRLPERCRSFLRVVLVDPPPSYEEIASALGVPIGTIGPRRQRCLAQLRAAVRA